MSEEEDEVGEKRRGVGPSLPHQFVLPELLCSDESSHHQLPVQLVETGGRVQEGRLCLEVRVLGGLWGGGVKFSNSDPPVSGEAPAGGDVGAFPCTCCAVRVPSLCPQ